MKNKLAFYDKSKILSIILILFSIFLSFTGFAKDSLDGRISIYKDPNNKILLKNLDSVPFHLAQKKDLNLGFYNGSVWLRIDLSDKGINQHSQLEIDNPNLDIIEVYHFSEGHWNTLYSAGDQNITSRQENPSRCFVVSQLPEDIFYIKITNFGDQLFIPIQIIEKQKLKQKEIEEHLVFGIYFGLLLFVIILNLFLYVVIKEKSNLYYLIYLGGLLLLNLGLTGIGTQYLWGESTYINNHTQPFAATLSVLFLIQFTRTFLDTITLARKLDGIFKWLSILLLLNLILSLIPYQPVYHTSIIVINATTLLLNILIIPTALLSLKNNKKIGLLFVSAFVVLIISVFVFVLRNFGIVNDSFISKNSLLIGSSVEIILLSFAIVQKFKAFKNEAIDRLKEINQLKNDQNDALEREIQAKTKEIQLRNKELEEKSNELLDSINYAERIQKGMVPNESYFQQFFKDSFVLYKPKDILSGDFYWISKTTTTKVEDKNSSLIVFALGDCTGHGVPGAMISVLGIKILNTSLKNLEVNTTGDALDYLNREITTTFNKEINDAKIADGMDIVICAYDEENSKLYFSGANNSLWLMRNSEIESYRGDRFAIGGFDSKQNFLTQSLTIEKGDKIFLMSDGYIDQFGGPKNKKYKSKRLKDFLIQHETSSMSELKMQLDQELITWQGGKEQIDDVSIIGIQF